MFPSWRMAAFRGGLCHAVLSVLILVLGTHVAVAAETAVEGCSSCDNRHQSLSRNKAAQNSGPSRQTIWFGYKSEGGTVLLSGELYRPDGAGEAPALILLHGCAGPWSAQEDWAARFQSWGYVALVLDGFTPRAVMPDCDAGAMGRPREPGAPAGAADAVAARDFLARLDFVDARRVGLVGWSHGGRVALDLAGAGEGPAEAGSFQAAVAFYPWCDAPERLDLPAMILSGTADDWAPASRCENAVAETGGGSSSVTLHLLDGATHAFDGTGGAIGPRAFDPDLRHNAEATDLAVQSLKAFLDDHLGG